nr:hypothetical protein [Tanacetum cinerariifolium]
MVAEDEKMSQDKEIDKLMALISLSFKKIYKPTNNNLQTSSNTSRENHDNSPRINRSAGYENQRIGNVVGERETVGSTTVQKSEIQCYNYKEFGHVARECQKPKRAKDAAYHKEKMLLYAADSGPIFDDEPLQKVSNDDQYNVFAMESEHPEQSKSVHGTYPIDQDAHNMIIDSLDMSEIKDFKDKNKSLESSNNHFKEANNKLSETNNLLYADYKKSEAELARRNSREYASQMEIKCAKLRAPESDEVIRLEKESRSKLSDLIKPFDYNKLNNLYDLFVPQREKSSEQRYFSERSRLSHTYVNNRNSKESFNKQTTVLEKRMDESISLDKKCQSSIEIFKVKTYVNTIITGVELCKEKIANRTYSGYIDPFIQKTIEAKFSPVISRINVGLEQFHRCLNDEMIADLRYFNSLELEDKGIVISELKKLIEKLKGKSVDTKFEKLSVIRQPNAFKSPRPSVLGKPTTFSNSFVRKDFSKSKSVTQNNVSNDFSKPVTTQTLPPKKESILKNTNVLALGMYKLHIDPNQARTSQLPQDSRKTNKRVLFSTGVILTSSVSRPQLKSNLMGDRVMRNNSQGKKQEVEDQSRNVKLPKNKSSVTACNDSLNTKILNVKFVSAMCDKCVLNDKHDMCVLNSDAKPIKKTVASESNQKPRNITKKLYERVSKTCSWWYPKFTPSGYKWKPKFGKENVNPSTSMPLGSLIEIVLYIIESGCSKHMTGNLKLLINFVEKFLGTVKFKNYQIAPILGYGDLVQGAVTIKRVYYVEGLNYNLFSVGQLCDADLEVAFRKSTCFIRDLKGNDLLIGSRGTELYSITLQDTNSPNLIFLMARATSSQAWLWHRRLSHLNFDTINLLSKNDIVNLHAYFATEGIHHQTSVARTPEQDGVVERRNRTLVEAARTMLSAAKLRAYRVFNKRTRVIMESIHVNFDELPQMASDHVSSNPAPECQRMALEHDSLSLVIQHQANVPQADRTVTTSNELDLLFSLMFDELLNGSSKVVSKSSVVCSADALNQCQQHTTPLNNHTTPAPTCQVPTLAPTITSSENINQAETYAENDQVTDDEFINIFCTPVQDQGETSSCHVDSSNMHTFYQRYPSKHRWTKDHPPEQVIGNPSQSVRTRRQLESHAKMCMFTLM